MFRQADWQDPGHVMTLRFGSEWLHEFIDSASVVPAGNDTASPDRNENAGKDACPLGARHRNSVEGNVNGSPSHDALVDLIHRFGVAPMFALHVSSLEAKKRGFPGGSARSNVGELHAANFIVIGINPFRPVATRQQQGYHRIPRQGGGNRRS